MKRVSEASSVQAPLKLRNNYAKLELQLFTIIAIAYYVLNILFPTDYAEDADNSARIYPQIAAGALAVLCLFVSFISVRKLWKNTIMRAFLLLLGLSFLYVMYPMKPVENVVYISRTYMGILAMFTLYLILCRIKDERDWKIAIYIIYVLQLAFCLSTLIADHSAFVNSTEKEFDSNAGFLLITCVPLALTIPAKRLRLYVYSLLLLACIYSGQRSAALAAVASLPFCLWYLKGSIKKTDIIIFAAIALIVALPLLQDALQNLRVRNETDFERGSIGSGRSIFYLLVIQGFLDGGPLHILIGNGTNSVVELLDRTYGLAIGAHNGWLDIMYTFGILGLILYGNIFIQILKRNKSTNLELPEYKNMYLIAFIIFFIKASTSHGYFDTDCIPFLTTIAMMEGFKDRRKLTHETSDSQQ